MYFYKNNYFFFIWYNIYIYIIMDMSIELKCSVTTAILSVLVYLLLVNLLDRSLGVTAGVGQEMNKTEWYKSMEIIMLVSVLLAYNINSHLFTSCKN